MLKIDFDSVLMNNITMIPESLNCSLLEDRASKILLDRRGVSRHSLECLAGVRKFALFIL